jgi:hypothetical protein
MIQTVFSYNLGSWPFLLLFPKKNQNNYFIFFSYFGLSSYIGFLLKYLIGLSDSYLIDIGMYESYLDKVIFNFSFVLWFLTNSNGFLSFFFFPLNKKNVITS